MGMVDVNPRTPVAAFNDTTWKGALVMTALVILNWGWERLFRRNEPPTFRSVDPWRPTAEGERIGIFEKVSACEAGFTTDVIPREEGAPRRRGVRHLGA